MTNKRPCVSLLQAIILLLSVSMSVGSETIVDPVGTTSRGASREVLISPTQVIIRLETTYDSRPSPLAAELAPSTDLSPGAKAAVASLGGSVSKTWLDGRFRLVTFANTVDIAAALERLRTEAGVRYAVPNYWITPAEKVPNDPEFASQWGLRNEDDADIDATLAWDLTTGSPTTLVAVMDSGVNYAHPDLYLAIALNAGEIPPGLMGQITDTNSDGQIDFYDLNSLDGQGDVVLDQDGEMFNQDHVTDLDGSGFIDAGDLMAAPWIDGIDNDGNGVIDDLTGWDHFANDNDPMDAFGHGTHVAGIIGARGDNGTGIAGVNWRARILPERFFDFGGGWTSDAIQAIEHAVGLGADVINASWGTFADDPALEEAIRWAGDNGVVFVAAAGNHSQDNDGPGPYFPASYDLPNLIGVGSVDSNGYLSSFSNYGVGSVHVAAPGRDILSLSLGGGYVLNTGTSMASPHVAGVVSLLAGQNPAASPAWLVDTTVATVKPFPDLTGKVAAGGIVSAFVAVNASDEGGPRVILASPFGDVLTPLDRVRLTFDRRIDFSSFTTADSILDGPQGTVVPSAVDRISDYIFDVVFPIQSNPGEYSLQVGPEIADLNGFVMDQDEDEILGEPDDDYFISHFRLPYVLVVDDGDPGFASSGSWSTYVGAGAQGDFSYKAVGSGTATTAWVFTGLEPGQYRVSTTWQAYSNRASDAPYAILDGSSFLETVTVDQTQSPVDFFSGGSWWGDLGGAHDVASGSLTVELSDSAGPSGRYVIADAVRLERIGDLPSGPEVTVLLDGANVADGVGSVDFGSTFVGAPLTRLFTVENAGTEDLVLGAISVPSGYRLVTDFGQAILAPGASTSFAVELEATAEGTFAGSVSFGCNDADENPFDFLVTGTAVVEVVSQFLILDDGDVGFTASGGWSTYAGAGSQGDFTYKSVGSGAATATWVFTNLVPGQYRISATWQAYSNRVVDAPYTILDGSSVLETIRVDQTSSPVDFFDDGSWWGDLGGAQDVTSGSLTVELTDSAGPSGRTVIADSIRIERVGDLPSGPEIQVLVDGTDVKDGVGAVDFGVTLVGAPSTRIFTVQNAGTETLFLGTITVPSGYSLSADFGQTTLVPGAATSFAVELDAAAEGTYLGSLYFDSNDADENPFDVLVTGTVIAEGNTQILIVDDGDAEFNAIGGWSTYVGTGAQGDFSYKGVGSGSGTAAWTFTGLVSGQYRVSATWQPYSNRAVDAPYAILDGSSLLATVSVDQRQSPAGFLEDGSWWQDLGEVYDVATGSLTVELSDAAGPSGSRVIADAIRIERVGDIPSGPEIQVVLDGANVQDGVDSVDYGTTLAGVPLAVVFAVHNTGTEDLLLGAITVPSGYRLAQDFGQTTLTPGATTDFAVELEAIAAGAYSGTVSLDCNDADENPFDFVISGTVTEDVVTQVLVVDDGDAGFAATGGWASYVGVGTQGDFSYKGVGSGTETATWTFSGLTPGLYRVSATWEPYVNRAVDAPYVILDGGSVLGTVPVDQRSSPADFLDDGSWWHDLGAAHEVTSASLTVELSDQAGPAGGYVIADAIRIERVGDLPSGPEIQVFLDGVNVVDGAGSVDYGTTLAGVPVAGDFTVHNAGTEDLVLGAITVPPGYRLAQDFGLTTLPPGATTGFGVELEAITEGSFSGTVSFGCNDADEDPFDVQVSGTVTIEVISQILVADNGDGGFSATGGWTTYVGVGAQGDFAYKRVGSGAETAAWTFTGLVPGQYRVSATWQAHSNRAFDAPYAIMDGGALLATVPVDQRQDPVDFFESGSWWQDLGTTHDVTTGSLTVELSDSASPSASNVIADAIRIERVGDVPSGPEIQVLLDGANLQDGSDSVDYGTTLEGVPMTRVFTVHNVGTENLDLFTITVPAGFRLAQDFGATTLSPGTTTSFSVELEATVEGSYSGSVSFGNNDADESPFDFVVSGTVSVEVIAQVFIMDDGDADFAANGGWTSYVGAGAQGDFAYKVVGSGAATASWNFTGLVPGQYRVSATWQAYYNRAADAPYAVLDGGALLATIPVDQRQSPADYSEDGVEWQDLGGVYDITSGTLTVELSDSASPSGNYVIVDAVRIERLGDLPAN